MKITTREIEWLAGLLEGEGCFGCVSAKRKNIRICLLMTDEDVVRKAAGLLGGEMAGYQPKQKTKNGELKKRIYSVQIFGKKAAAWMMTLYSLMGARRKAKIEESLAAWRLQKAKSPSGTGIRNPRCLAEVGLVRNTTCA